MYDIWNGINPARGLKVLGHRLAAALRGRLNYRDHFPIFQW